LISLKRKQRAQRPSRTRPGPVGACLALLLASGSAGAGERDDFLAAEEALKSGDLQVFEDLASDLRDYPLYPYLRFESLRRDLGMDRAKEVEQFLDDFEDTPLAPRLRRAWLNRLAAVPEWGDYARLYRPDGSTDRKCHYLRALIETGRSTEALPQIEPLWRSLPKACDPVLDAWMEAGRLTEDLVWARIALAIDAGQTRLARYLDRFLHPGERIWLDRWLALRDNPEGAVELSGIPESHPQRARILAYGLKRLSEVSPERGGEALRLLEKRGELPEHLIQASAAAVGFALAERGDARGLDYLDRLPANSGNLPLQERRLRLALALGDWPRVAAWVEAMPDGQLKSEHWVYWQARALDIAHRADDARRLYQEAAKERSLWGFLAAERVDLPYPLESRPVSAAPERIAFIEQSPAARRIAELGALGRDLDVRREWRHLSRNLEPEDLKAAAVVACRRGWPDQAIFTLARSGYWDDLVLRFPLLHREEVTSQAIATGLDEAWIYAILRQESAFNPGAVSHAGAVGLMQLMPATARSVASALGRPGPRRSELLDPQHNITLGSVYLAEMQSRFGDHPALAAAAYNAGPHRVERWLPEEPMDADVWVATIPFAETRGYVRRVLAYRVIYHRRLGTTVEPLSELMKPISQLTDRVGLIADAQADGAETDTPRPNPEPPMRPPVK